MSMTTPELRDETEQTAPEFEGEMREVLRRDASFWRRREAQANEEAPADNMSALISRVAGASVLEIERVITELQGVRDMLRSEGDRVQREISGYANLSQAAMDSMKIIADSMAQWKPNGPRVTVHTDAPRMAQHETE